MTTVRQATRRHASRESRDAPVAVPAEVGGRRAVRLAARRRRREELVVVALMAVVLATTLVLLGTEWLGTSPPSTVPSSAPPTQIFAFTPTPTTTPTTGGGPA